MAAVARYVQSKDSNQGIVEDETKAGFEMEWQK